ncbi:hypothetical protein [Shinella sp. JR1-6]|uniref:hypothetical protein n=1 Tax=Shinella sp. JR1-6 TaxID=2527671 RepID=UPI001FE00780|nr:hypothetical protein [Shinella sp. JR1-6]
MMPKSYDEKMARIRAGTYRSGDFILVDAKDADISGGILTTGFRRGADGIAAGSRTRREFLAEMETLIAEKAVDVMLGSASNIERLVERGSFDGSPVTPAFRANETTDVWLNIRGGRYRETPAQPYRGADLLRAQAELCLFSMTFNNDAVADVAMLEAYRTFRADARTAGKRHFLEVFNPNAATGFGVAGTGAFVNDCIVRALASLARAERPEFLKIVYNGRRALEELVAHDDTVVVGVMGGASGTHRDAMEMVARAEASGARLAIFGRKINLAEHQLSLTTWMRAVANRNVTPAEAVRGYHGDLQRFGLKPDRALDLDNTITDAALREDGSP